MNILKKIGVLNVEEANDLPYFILIRLCSFLGELAICQLSFLDETVYKEIKRRLYVTAEKHNSKGRNAAKNKNVSSASLSRRNANTNSSTIVDDVSKKHFFIQRGKKI